MTAEEYSYIIQVINENSYERSIFLRIRSELEQHGYNILQISYEDYLMLRERKIRDGNQETSLSRQTVANVPPYLPENVRNATHEQKSKRIKACRDDLIQILKTLIIAGPLVGLGFIFPTISLPIWGIALCVLAWGLKDVIPYPENYDADYVDRYFRIQEEARMKTHAYLHQANLHRGEIERLYKMISKKG